MCGVEHQTKTSTLMSKNNHNAACVPRLCTAMTSQTDDERKTNPLRACSRKIPCVCVS